MLDARLDGHVENGAHGKVRGRRTSRTCKECGEPYAPLVEHSEFCGTPCRRAWNNRRMTRGAELYDLLMALRYDRKASKALKVWRLICRMTAGYYEEDQAQRSGRQSWRPTRDVLESRPYLHADVVVRGRSRAPGVRP